MAGCFAVLNHVPKTFVHEMARYRNSLKPDIPENVFVEAPSAESRPEQKDSDSIPEYPELDPVLGAYVEKNWSPEEMVAAGFDHGTVRQVIQPVDQAEYKRRQAPPGVRITTLAFGKDRRLPITNPFREGAR
jgi:NAD+ synthase (glutamine-hydrolysing)